jgi:hypothetical protein
VKTWLLLQVSRRSLKPVIRKEGMAHVVSEVKGAILAKFWYPIGAWYNHPVVAPECVK